MNSSLGRLRVLASVFMVLTVVLGFLGLTALVPDPGLAGDVIFWIPAAVAVFGLLTVTFVVDPVLLPRRNVSRTRVGWHVNAMMIARLLVAQLPVAAGIVVGSIAQSDPSVIVGSGASVVLLLHWWPGRHFANVVRARLARAGAPRLTGPAGA